MCWDDMWSILLIMLCVVSPWSRSVISGQTKMEFIMFRCYNADTNLIYFHTFNNKYVVWYKYLVNAYINPLFMCMIESLELSKNHKCNFRFP